MQCAPTLRAAGRERGKGTSEHLNSRDLLMRKDFLPSSCVGYRSMNLLMVLLTQPPISHAPTAEKHAITHEDVWLMAGGLSLR